ncbi:hypothetical protein B0H10DRAFT_2220307 [Mycena sp. CBHHK59/15]|nr:hypothetical protein B0H10DRAFT_2220307 [Mycena sp. CBHHK59/15]
MLCVIATTLGLHVAFTSPNPPLKAADRVIAPTAIEFMLNSSMFPRIQKALYWCVAVVEIVTIPTQLGSPPWSQRILTALAFGGEIGAVRLTPFPALGSILIVGGAVLRLQCYRALGKHFTFETGISKNHTLVKTGPYKWARHPSYAGAVMVYAGLILYYGSPGTWAMECVFKGSVVGMVFCVLYALMMSLVVLGLLCRMSKEDEGLRQEFGHEWVAWATEVPYALVPGVF